MRAYFCWACSAAVAAVSLALVATPARADAPPPATAEPAEPPPLGTPLRSTPSADPAMTGVSFLVPSAGAFFLPATPTIHTHGSTIARRSNTFATMSIGNRFGGGPGLHTEYSFLGVDFGLFSVGGDATSSFTADGHTYDSGHYVWMGFGLPSVGISYQRTGFAFGASLVPRVEYYSAFFTDHVKGQPTISGTTFLLTASADVHACLEYNFAGVPKNSALCAYVGPSIYRDGLFNGVTAGLRLFMF